MSADNQSKRRFLLGAGSLGALWLTGCDRLSQTEWFPKVLRTHETLSRGVHKVLGSRPSMAQEFTEADLSPFFRSNGTSMPEGEAYQALAKNGFADWRLEVDGLVEKPVKLSLAELRAMPRRTQITRHDCVEGWSAIGKWTGVPLSNVLALVKPQASARYVVFHCADEMGRRPDARVLLRKHRHGRCDASADDSCVRVEWRRPADRRTVRRFGCASSGSSATSTPST